MAFGTKFGSYSSPQIDRESDMLRELERLRMAAAQVVRKWDEIGPGGSGEGLDDLMEDLRQALNNSVLSE